MKTIQACLLLALFGTLTVSGCTRPYRPQPAAKAKPVPAVGAVKEKELDEEAKIAASLAKLDPKDRALALAQGFCAASPDSRLGSMGAPPKIMVKGQPVFLCCIGCEGLCRKDEDKTLAIVADLKEKVAHAAQEQDIQATLAKLGKDDATEAAIQKFCPIEREHRLGFVGVPVKVTLKGEDVYLCCGDCREAAEKDADKTLAIAHELTIAGNLAGLSAEDRKLAEAQRFCAVSNESRLGSMGTPAKVLVQGQPVFLCCPPCAKQIKDEAKTLAIVEDLKKKNARTPAPKQ